MLGAAGAAGLYRRSVKRWYWVLVYVLLNCLYVALCIFLSWLGSWMLPELLSIGFTAGYQIAAFN